jgi:hypothetical protein
MAKNKNQHFVPRCHLRPFSLDEEKKCINLINLRKKKLITNAALKHQCSKDYFYGTDYQLEKAIQMLETGYASTLQSLLASSNCLTEGQQVFFRIFWLFQHLRTEAAAKQSVLLANSIRDFGDLESDEPLFTIKDAVQNACHTFSHNMHLIDDLKFCLFKNKTDVPFITSDNPAIITNKWHLENKATVNRSFGMGSAGMLAILPLTPQLLLLGYDGDVYSIAKNQGITEIKNARDAIALNRHQFLQCDANIYVHDASHGDTLINHFQDIEHARPANRHVIHYAQIDSKTSDHTRYVVTPHDEIDNSKEAILHSQVIHPNPGIWPSQIRIRNNGSVYTNGSGMGVVRKAHIPPDLKYSIRRERP